MTEHLRDMPPQLLPDRIRALHSAPFVAELAFIDRALVWQALQDMLREGTKGDRRSAQDLLALLEFSGVVATATADFLRRNR